MINANARDAQRPPAGSRTSGGRASWHLRANALVLMWLLAAAAVAIAHRWIDAAPWLMVHLTMLGAVTTAILIWSAHFTQALRRRALPTGNRGQAIRLATHTGGVLAVVLGLLTQTDASVTVGAILVGGTAIWHACEVVIASRGSLANRLAWSTWAYVAASAYLVVGVVCGVLLSRTPGDAAIAARLYVAHVTLMLMGWVALTIVATLVTLWPTILAMRVDERALRWAKTGVVTVAVAVPLAALGAAAGTRTGATIAMVVVTTGLALSAAAVARLSLLKHLATASALHVLCGVAWIVGVSLAWAWALVVQPTWVTAQSAFSALVPAFVAGGAAQVVVGSLQHLIPMIMGGGPHAVRSARNAVERGGVARVVLVNGGLLLWLLPTPSLVSVVGSVVALAGGAWAIVALLRAVMVSRQARRDGPPQPQVVPVDALSTTPRLRGGLQGVMAAMALVALSAGAIAADPAAAGIGVSSQVAVQPTGETVTVEIEAADMRFTMSDVAIGPGDHVVVNLTNTDAALEHDLVFETGQASGRLQPGESTTMDLGVVSSDLDGWCSIAGHRQMGMSLTLDVDDETASAGDGVSGPAGGDGSEEHHMGSADGAAGAASAADDIDLAAGSAREATDATLAPARDERVHDVTIEVTDETLEVAPGATQELWTFNGTAPGPTLRGKVGDTFRVTLVNNGSMGHSIDFHAGMVAPDEAMRTIQPGESLVYEFTAEHAGAWLYHCSTTPMSVHIANGMYGAVIIDPPNLEPVDREYVLVQSEMYLGPQGGSVDADKVVEEDADLVVFNGHATQYVDHPLPARVGERVRVWVVDAGPSRASAFHVVGTQFDTVYSEGAYLLGGPDSTEDDAGGAQVLSVAPGSGGFVEMTFPEAGTYPFVSHIMIDAERGAKGLFAVSEPEGE